jgi:transketolase
MRLSFIQSLCAAAERDGRVHLLTADLGYSVVEPFARAFPKRFTNVGVAEQNLIGVAAGLALCGKVAFVYSIANFPTLRCLEQIRNDVCHHQADVKIVAVGGGLAYGAQGYTHHGVEDLAVMRALPGMTVVAPGDPVETGLATRALARQPGPAYMRLGKAREPVVHASPPPFRIGRAISVRPGRDATLISTGTMLSACVAAAADLLASGLDVGVLSMPTLKPLDERAVRRAARRTRAVVTVEEHSAIGGLGSAVADVLMTRGPRCRFARVALPDEVPHEVGSQEYLRRRLGDVAGTVRALVRRAPGGTARPAGRPRRGALIMPVDAPADEHRPPRTADE